MPVAWHSLPFVIHGLQKERVSVTGTGFESHINLQQMDTMPKCLLLWAPTISLGPLSLRCRVPGRGGVVVGRVKKPFSSEVTG